MAIRFSAKAAKSLREGIREAGGVEVFAIGRMDPLGRVSSLEIHCRGDMTSTPALMLRPRAGEVVIHNHPSGDVRPSQADYSLASRYGDEGVGVVIVDSALTIDNWVVEPASKRAIPIDYNDLKDFFNVKLSSSIEGYERREGQLPMALAIGESFDSGGTLIAEAGTGTGKSLAYLIPSVMWALANDSKVVISTYTKNLQAQLISSDIPIARRSGLEFEHALIKGRGNYICKRKLGLALADVDDDDNSPDSDLIKRIGSWAKNSAEGSLQDFGEIVDDEIWERVRSETDQTLRARCPHYNDCFYYKSRRKASSSHILVVNHALAIADLHLKGETGGDGILPRYERLVLDEAHHIEDAATSAISQSLTKRSLRRALGPLVKRRKRKGALARLKETVPIEMSSVHKQLLKLEVQIESLVNVCGDPFDMIGETLLSEQCEQRLTEELLSSELYLDHVAPLVEQLSGQVGRCIARLGALEASIDGVELSPKGTQAVLDINRAINRLKAQQKLISSGSGEAGVCRWVESTKGQGSSARLATAPIEVAKMLEELLWHNIDGIVATSATLSVSGNFDHFISRTGATDASTAVYDSPFDYHKQAALMLPRDLPRPQSPDWESSVAECVIDLVGASRGGAFVLCTSHALVKRLGAALNTEHGHELPILVQGTMSREKLLRNFQRHGDSVLVGTDSFWEGISVKGDALRLVIIPRLPFRVPSHPVAQARYELIEASGRDPFRAWALPEAVLRLRQGFGRLIRSKSDRGAVAILDRRVHEVWYGRVFLNSLPPAERMTGPTRSIRARLGEFLGRA